MNDVRFSNLLSQPRAREAPALRVILDGAALQAGQPERGIARYVRDFILAVRRNTEVETLIRFHRKLRPLPIGDLLEPHLREDQALIHLIDNSSVQTPTVFLQTSPFEWELSGFDVIPRWVTKRRISTAAIGYDLIPLIFPEKYFPTQSHERVYNARLAVLKTVDRILTISESTKVDFVRLLGLSENRVQTIGTGVDLQAFGGEMKPNFSRQDIASDTKLILCVGGYEPRKNVPRLIEAWGKIPRTTRHGSQLVVVCDLPQQGRDEWTAIAKKAGLHPPDYRFTGKISDNQLKNLYRSAQLVVVPSLYEGFGLPVAEAAAVGTPVICSSISAMPEILGDSSFTFDPNSVDSIAGKIEEMLSDHSLYDSAIAKLRELRPSLGWDPVVGRALDALVSIADIPLLESRPKRGIVLLSPTKPSMSGVGVYSSGVLAAMSEKTDVTLYRDDSPTGDPPGIRSAHLLKHLDSRHRGEEVLVVLGNSDYHMDCFHYLLENQAHVWLHDLNLAGLVTSCSLRFKSVAERVDWINGLLAAENTPAAFFVDESNYLDLSRYRANGVRFLGATLRNAKSVIVNSEHAQGIIENTGQLRGQRILVVPLAYEKPLSQAEKSSDPLLVSLGWVGPSKCPERLIKILAMLPENVVLAFVGPVEKEYASKLLSLSNDLGRKDRVVFTGAVDEVDYWNWCTRSSIGVQLRDHNNGESSATVRDFMSAGTCVVTNLPSASSLPEETVLALVPDASDQEVAKEILNLLNNDELRRSREDQSLRYVRRWTFGDVADVVRDHISAK